MPNASRRFGPRDSSIARGVERSAYLGFHLSAIQATLAALFNYRSAIRVMARRYDKGEKRFKHEGSGPKPEIQFVKNQPRRFVGKCPAGVSAEVRTQLLNEAIAAPVGDREIDYPKYLYAVHNGAIYEARTSDAGITYHGFPYRGKLAKQLIEQLRTIAQDKSCLEAFETWVKNHIQVV